MIRGHFIVIEGIDGSGTTTQAAAIGKEFAKLGLAAHVTAEPSMGLVGSIIRQVLAGRLTVHDSEVQRNPSWKSMALLFAADRQDHLEAEIMPNIRDGVSVICDRYVYSSVIYQSLSSNAPDAKEWIRELNRFATTPDLVIFLRVSPELALVRRRQRDRRPEMFEEPEFQERLAKEYDNLPGLFPNARIVTVDGHASSDDVTAECWAAIEKLRAEGAPA